MVSPRVAGEEIGGGARARFRGGVWRTAVGDQSKKLRGAPHPGPGPEQPRSRPRDADPWVANFPRPFPRAPRRHGGYLGLVCVPEGVSVRASRSRTSLGQEGGGIASRHLGGGTKGRSPRRSPRQEPLPQPVAARPEISRLLID